MNWFRRKIKTDYLEEVYHQSEVTSNIESSNSKTNNQLNEPVTIKQLPSHYMINGYSEVRVLADRLKNSEDIIINVGNLETAERKRVLDFLSGATYILNGSAEKVGPTIYLFSVSNVKLNK